MTETIKLKFYKIDRCGYFKYGEDSQQLTNVSDTLDDLKNWISSKTLVETKTTNILTAKTEKLPVYCVAVEKSSMGNYLLVTWNEIEATNGSVSSINADEPVSSISSNLEETELPEGNIPGFATYFWFCPEDNILATIKFNHVENGHLGMNYFLKGFLTRFSKYTVIREIPREEREDEDIEEIEILGYSSSSNYDEQLHPYFSSKLKRLAGQIDEIRRNKGSISKIIRKTSLSSTITNDVTFYEKLLYKLGIANPSHLNENLDIKYEVKTQPSSQELEDIINNWQENHEPTWDDVGFHITGKTSPLWLSSEVPSKELDIEIERNNNEFVDFDELLIKLDDNKDLLRRVYSGDNV